MGHGDGDMGPCRLHKAKWKSRFFTVNVGRPFFFPGCLTYYCRSAHIHSFPSALWQDDIIDDVDSFLAAAETLKERGAYKIFVMATHGLLSSDAPRLIEESAIDEVTGSGCVWVQLPGLLAHLDL